MWIIIVVEMFNILKTGELNLLDRFEGLTVSFSKFKILEKSYHKDSQAWNKRVGCYSRPILF